MLQEQALRIYNEITVLNLEQQLYILNRLLADAMRRMTPEASLDITGLRGLGKEIWRGIDAQEYVNHERNSWE